MNSIILTEEQEEKFLEMVKMLFPEYKNIFMDNKDQELNFTENDFIVLDDDYVHWFEFLVIYLVPKVLKGWVDNCYSDNDLRHDDYYVGNIGVLNKNKIHPIEYVYEQFCLNNKYLNDFYIITLGNKGSIDCSFKVHYKNSFKEFLIDSFEWKLLSNFWDINNQEMFKNAYNEEIQNILKTIYNFKT
jgi:hypothetical protein